MQGRLFQHGFLHLRDMSREHIDVLLRRTQQSRLLDENDDQQKKHQKGYNSFRVRFFFDSSIGHKTHGLRQRIRVESPAHVPRERLPIGAQGGTPFLRLPEMEHQIQAIFPATRVKVGP